MQCAHCTCLIMLAYAFQPWRHLITPILLRPNRFFKPRIYSPKTLHYPPMLQASSWSLLFTHCIVLSAIACTVFARVCNFQFEFGYNLLGMYALSDYLNQESYVPSFLRIHASCALVKTYTYQFFLIAPFREEMFLAKHLR